MPYTYEPEAAGMPSYVVIDPAGDPVFPEAVADLLNKIGQDADYLARSVYETFRDDALARIADAEARADVAEQDQAASSDDRLQLAEKLTEADLRIAELVAELDRLTGNRWSLAEIDAAKWRAVKKKIEEES